MKALQSLRPATTEEASDRETTADWAEIPVEAGVSTDNTAGGDTSRNVAAAQIGDIHQHPLGDVYTNMMAEHMRAFQTVAGGVPACDAPILPVAGTSGAIPTTEPGAINAVYRPVWAGLPNFASVGIATTGQRQTTGHGPVYLAASLFSSCRAGKSSVTYHDIVEFVTKYMVDEQS